MGQSLTSDDFHDDENTFLLPEENSKLEEIVAGTEETLNQFLKAIESLKSEPMQRNEACKQTIQEVSEAHQHKQRMPKL